MPDFRGDIRRAIFRAVSDDSTDITQDAIGITKILAEFSKRYKDFDQLEKLNIELTVPIQLPPNGNKGDCKAVVLEVQKSLNELGGGSRIYHALGSWLDDENKLVADHCVVVFSAIPLNAWFECIKVLRRLIRDVIQTNLFQECVFLRIDNQTFGGPLNLLGKQIESFPGIDEFGGIDPACMKMMGEYVEHPIQTQIRQEIKGDDNVQISSGGDTSFVSGAGAISATNLTIVHNHGPIITKLSKEMEEVFEKLKHITDPNIAKSDKIGELEEKLAKLVEENEKLRKKVGEVDNPPPSLLNQMDNANRRLTKLISEFRTPGTVAQIMVRLAKPTGGKIYDGCCGDGDLLLEAHRYAETEPQNEPLQFYGQELNEDAWNQAKANFAIQGINVDLGPSHGSTLHSPHHIGLSVDYVISDIPYGLKLSPKLDPEDPRWALIGQIGIRDGDVAWILHSLHQLASSGICIIHLPVDILFRSNKETSALRKFLVEENVLSGIVALKPKITPLISKQTCILILEKRGSHSVRKPSRGVFMMDCSAYEGIKRQNFYSLSKHEISSIVDAYTDWQEKSANPSVDLPPNCKVITAEDIIENDYNLMPDRYL